MSAFTDQKLQQAVDSHRQGRLAEAEAAYREVLGVEPGQPDALHLLGVTLTQTGRFAEGADRIHRSLAIQPDQPLVYANLGNALSALGQYEQALAAYERTTQALPEYAPAYNGRGNVLSKLGRWPEAIVSYRHALERMPGLVEAHSNLGLALAELRRWEEALASYDRALALSPQHASALIGRGNARVGHGEMLLEQGRPAEALTAFESMLDVQPEHTTALFLRGRALMQMGRPAQAADCFRRVHDLDPSYQYVLGARLWAQLHACAWETDAALRLQIEEATMRGGPAAFPFVLFSACDSPELHLGCAREFARRHRVSSPPLWQGERYAHERIRLAYVSEDFRGHPTSYLLAGLWELHDRRRFETFALSLRPAEDSDIGRRVRNGFDHFIDVSTLSDDDIARRLRELEIDIAVDLMGYTGGNFRGWLSRRPVPIQVGYLGYPGTLGGDSDYLIADEFLIPEANRGYFTEEVVYLPGTYHPNDHRRVLCASTSTRAEAGLPPEGFVWCSFNNAYKFNPRLFDTWCNLLRAVPGSVLWLIPGSAEAESNLRREAAARGIDPERLVFARGLPQAEHLARIALADLCLDTAPVNGATTTSDALWAGVPVVTRAGRSFVSRMAGSLLTGVGLPELITTTWQQYESLAIELATNPARLVELRVRLNAAKSGSLLFDTDRARRHLEAAFVEMWERRQRGEPPRSFGVAPV